MMFLRFRIIHEAHLHIFTSFPQLWRFGVSFFSAREKEVKSEFRYFWTDFSSWTKNKFTRNRWFRNKHWIPHIGWCIFPWSKTLLSHTFRLRRYDFYLNGGSIVWVDFLVHFKVLKKSLFSMNHSRRCSLNFDWQLITLFISSPKGSVKTKFGSLNSVTPYDKSLFLKTSRATSSQFKTVLIHSHLCRMLSHVTLQRVPLLKRGSTFTAPKTPLFRVAQFVTPPVGSMPKLESTQVTTVSEHIIVWDEMTLQEVLCLEPFPTDVATEI